MKITPLRTFARRHGTLLLVGLVLFVTLLPIFLRVTIGSPPLEGAETYLHVRQAETVLDGSIHDSLRGEQFIVTPYTLLIALFSYMHWLLPFFLGIATLLLLRKFLRRTFKGEFVTLMTLVIIILSPFFITATTTHSPELAALALGIGTLLLFRKHMTLGCVLLTLTIITEPITGILLTTYLLLDALIERRVNNAIGVFIALIVAIIWYGMWMRATPSIDLLQNTNVFFEFGVQGGLTVFLIILAGYGAFVKNVPAKNKLLVLIVGLLALSPFIWTTPILTVLLAFLASFAIKELFTTKWELDVLRQLTIILIFCVGLFVVTVAISEQVAGKPDAAFVESMKKIGNDRHSGNILTDPQYAPLVEYYSGRKATLVNPSPDELHLAFYSRRPEAIYTFLEATDTGFIYIDAEMQERIFTQSEEGILFVLPNTKRFVVLSQGEATVWYYIARGGKT